MEKLVQTSGMMRWAKKHEETTYSTADSHTKSLAMVLMGACSYASTITLSWVQFVQFWHYASPVLTWDQLELLRLDVPHAVAVGAVQLLRCCE